MSWFSNLFIKEAKNALKNNAAPSDEQVASAVEDYLDKKPVYSATATIENGVLKVV